MDSLFGLPAHPLLVHLPIVAIPVLSILAIVMALKPSVRERYGPGVIVLAVITTITTFLAAASGTSLAEDVGKVEAIAEHQQHGETLRLLVLLLTLMVIAQTIDTRRRGHQRDVASTLLAVAVLASAVLSVVWVVRTGHSGAESVWGFLS